MEESLRFLFDGFEPDKAAEYSPLVLAYIGDAVYELIVRSRLLARGNRPVNRLHKESANLVKASSQAGIIKALLPTLSEEEKLIYKRGRNAHSHSIAKNASVSDYRQATGMEALIGYLYIKGDIERACEIAVSGMTYIEGDEDE